MTRIISLVAPAFLAMAFALSPGAAHAQISVDVGGTAESVGSTVGGAATSVGNSVGGTVGGVGNAVGGTVGNAGNAVGGTVDAVTSGSSTTAPGVPVEAIVTLDQNAALELVRSNRALPLEQIMMLARLEIEGEIVDAHLIQVRGFLLYELKVVDADGDVSDIYFYARSGERVQTN